MSIDLRLMRYVTTLAEHGSFTRAADALDIAQSTLSRAIGGLEATIGLQLFTRSRHGVEATDFGYLFLQQAASVSAQVADLEREVALAQSLHKGELSVGLGPYAAELLLPHALPRFVSAYPRVRIRVQVDSLEVLGRALRQRALDLVIGEATIPGHDESIDVFESLDPIKAYLFVRAGHPLAAANPSLRDVLNYPLVQISRLPPRVLKPFLDALDVSSTAAHPVPIPAIECPSVPFAIDIVLGSDAVILVSLAMVKRELASHRVVPVVHETWMHGNWSFMKLRHRSISPAASEFLSALRSAHAACLAEDAALENRWRACLPQHRTAGDHAMSRVRNQEGESAAQQVYLVAGH